MYARDIWTIQQCLQSGAHLWTALQGLCLLELGKGYHGLLQLLVVHAPSLPGSPHLLYEIPLPAGRKAPVLFLGIVYGGQKVQGDLMPAHKSVRDVQLAGATGLQSHGTSQLHALASNSE